MKRSPLSDDDYGDIQGLVRFGYGRLKAARYHLLTIDDTAAARAWLSQVPVTTAIKGSRPPQPGDADWPEGAVTAVNVAFTYDGLKKLHGASSILQQFPYEFRSGMTEASRARRLGDVAANDPRSWRWGAAQGMPHVLMLLYAATDPMLDAWEEQLKDPLWHKAFKTLACLTTTDIGDIEPFGFDDGISQPKLDWERMKSERIYDTAAYGNVSALGEFLLGYPNEYGEYTDRPLLKPKEDPEGMLRWAEDVSGQKDLGRNGTYLVMRDLAQDAPAFWRFVNEQAARDSEDRNNAAAAIVGREPYEIPVMHNDQRTVDRSNLKRTRSSSGAPLVPLSDDAIAGVEGPDDIRLNQFTFHKDPRGIACPYGAHIRRANPRNADLPEGTLGVFARLLRTLGFGRQSPRDDLIASTRFHRILRRGREYVFESAGEGGRRVVERGLRFICLNANISRQFEFIQASWLANPKFEGLDEGDPLIGNRTPLYTRPSDTFTRPQASGLCRRSAALPQFVHVLGGAYFFMPGVSALRYLARAEATKDAGPTRLW